VKFLEFVMCLKFMRDVVKNDEGGVVIFSIVRSEGPRPAPRLFCGPVVSSHPCNLNVPYSRLVGVCFIFYLNFLNYYSMRMDPLNFFPQFSHLNHQSTSLNFFLNLNIVLYL
jgi:hypothetical protein